MKLKTEKLRKLCSILIDHAEDQLKDEMDLSYSTFWVTKFKDGQKLEQPVPTVADLRDDIKEILERLDDDDCMLSVLDFDRLGNIIKAIGYEIYKR